MKKLLYIFLIFQACSENVDKSTEVKTLTESERVLLSTTDSIKVANFWQKAMKAPIYSVERQHYLDSALIIKPDSAYFWQQKAMPLYKERKFSLGKPFLEKAVLYDPERYLDYSGFMKCLFSNEYQESIDELNLAKEKFGDGYVMDHTYNFYIALDYLQMNQFANAKKYLLKYNVKVGAQTCSSELKGAYTGDVSVEIISDIGCKYCIIGHSERREFHNETNAFVKKAGLINGT